MFYSSINKRVMSQITNSILMIKPTGFTYNAETAENNHFQNPITTQNQKQISENALREFDNMVYTLDSKGVNITVLEPNDNHLNPDAVFPNNWFSLHKDGTKVLYPMFAKSRRKERDLEIFNALEKNLNFKIKSTVDLTIHEQENLYLEGTGSMILDRENKIAYAALSERTSKKILVDFSQKMNYNIVQFNALHTVNNIQSPIYHTNVMMCIGDSFSVICLETIYDQLEKVKVLNTLCQYIVPKLQSADYQIGSPPDGQSAISIQFVDSKGNDISDKKQDEIKHLQTLDENDLGLAQDLNKIFNGN